MNYIKSTKKAVQFYANYAGFPATGQDEVIYIDKFDEKAYRWNTTGSNYVEISKVGSFTDLTDTPGTYYSGDAGKVVVVNQTVNGLEFVDLSSILSISAGDAIDITTTGTVSTISLDVNPNGDVIQDGNNTDTLIFNSGGATAGYVLSADGSNGTDWTHVDDLITDGGLTSTDGTIDITGSGAVLFDDINIEIAPGSVDTVMTTDVNGDIVWVDKSDFDVTPDSATVSNGLEFVSGDGVDAVLQSFEIGIKDGGVTTGKIADGNVTTGKIADGNVTPAKIEGTSGTSGQVLTTDGSAASWQTPTVSTTNITDKKDLTAGDGSITVATGTGATLVDTNVKVTDGGITAVKLATDAVETHKIKDQNVTPAKIKGSSTPGQVLTSDGSDGAYWSSLANFMNFKGSVADLTALQGKESTAIIGDVWNVEDDGNHEHVNYVFVGSGGDTTAPGGASGAWDNLGGSVNLSGYVETTDKHVVSADLGTIDVDHTSTSTGDFGIKGDDNINTAINGRDVEVSLKDDITVDSLIINSSGSGGINAGSKQITDVPYASADTDAPNWGQVKAELKKETWAIDLTENENLIIYPVNEIIIESAPAAGHNPNNATLTVVKGGTPISLYPHTVAANSKLEFSASALESVWKLVITES